MVHINQWLSLQLSILLLSKQSQKSFQSLKLHPGSVVFLFLHYVWEIGCGRCPGWSKLQIDLWLYPFQSAISAVRYDLASAYQTCFPLTSGRCCSGNKRVAYSVAMPFVSSLCWQCRVWNRWAPQWFSQEYEQ